MKMDYELKVDHLIVGKKELVTVTIEVDNPSEQIKRGAIISENGAIIADGEEVFGVVAETPVNRTGKVRFAVYVEGDFNIEEVSYGSVSKDKIIKACKKTNIYLRTLGGK